MQINIPFQPIVHNHNRPDGIYGFDAPGIAKRFRHAAIFGALDSLQPGERLRFVNDHNPIPLLQQMLARYGDRVDIQYRPTTVPRAEAGCLGGASPCVP